MFVFQIARLWGRPIPTEAKQANWQRAQTCTDGLRARTLLEGLGMLLEVHATYKSHL